MIVVGLAVQVFFATLMADFGGAIGLTSRVFTPKRLFAMIWIAAGVMLAVTLCDVGPEAFGSIGVPLSAVAFGSGALLLWFVSKHVYHVCPSCAISDLQEVPANGLGRGFPFVAAALGLHSLLDGLGLAASHVAQRQVNWGLFSAIALHKLPEGAALALLCIGAGLNKKQAISACIAIESFTLIGGLLGWLGFAKISPALLTAIEAHVVGGFVYLIFQMVQGTIKNLEKSKRRVLIAYGVASFLTAASFLLTIAKVQT